MRSSRIIPKASTDCQLRLLSRDHSTKEKKPAVIVSSCVQVTKDGIVLAIIFWLKVDYCFPIMSCNDCVLSNI